ncbi:efflux RND transporter periplasmic adaptor subunit [Devosia sp. 1566]|uniref:efflux RND transporter periplasmic adaptor subunit n=1 Tax=Devosia sp. 1566 TaxID=2499144 RepID=UPI0020BF39C7|nr:efflux RND transporter periplasmic adaptor subunit [Devosia sp. 1566]
MIRQLLASVIILAAAALAWVFFAPGATQTLASYGIALPFGSTQEVANAPPAGRPGGAPGAPDGAPRGPAAGPGANSGSGPGGRGPGGPRGASRQTNVVTTGVTLATINDTLSAIGEGTAVRSVTVVSSAGGTLTEVLVAPGQEVAAGDVIARLEADAEQLALDRARLAADDADATLARTEGLASSNVVANTALTAAQLAAANADLEVRNAELALARRTITSPISGTVGLIQVTPGNYVGAQTTVTTIDDIASVRVDFWVPERYTSIVQPGTPITVSALAVPGRTFEGEISALDNRVDPASRTLQVQAEIPNEDGTLRPGMSFQVALRFPGETYPAVNPLAILWSTEGSYVWKYVEGRAVRVSAEIVQRNSDGVLVRADLEPGDAIITEGVLQLSEGAQVTLLEGPDGTGGEQPQAASAS